MPQNRQLAAVMFTDIVGFTFLMGKDEGRGLAVLEHNRQLHQECVAAANGRLVKEIGDGMLAWFSTASEAVQCAVNLQTRVRSHDYQLRVGVHMGEVVLSDDDVFGNTVNIASRVEGVANPGAVFATEEVVEAIGDTGGLDFVFLGEKSLKNVEPQMRIFGLNHPQLAKPELKIFLEESIEQDVKQYHLIEKIAAGGMGVIYKALDLKLQRPVALKFLSLQLNQDEQAQERFLEEARAAAALPHPNICTIYEIDETEEGRYFIAMELIEGPTLKEHLQQKGALPLKKAIKLAVQLAEGLAHAHRAGVVHRDIKSANIKITSGEKIKILDFGLAFSGNVKKFKMGSRVGTIAYMAPEQTRGENTDFRSDIWSFGVVLYEMLSGRLPFGSEYDLNLIHAILKEQPAPLSSEVPPALINLIDWCLEKDPEFRLQTADDLSTALRRLQRDIKNLPKENFAPPKPVRRFYQVLSRRPWLTPLALLLCLALGWALANSLRPPIKEAALVSEEAVEMSLFTGMGNLSLFPAWSPDGEWVVYVSDEDGSMDIWKKKLSGGQAIRLTGAPGNEAEPAWSPDGRSIALRGDWQGGGVFIIPADGGTPFRLTEFGRSPAWSPDSRRLAFTAYGNIYLVPVSGGDPQVLVEGTSANPHPIWTRDGKRILFWHRTRGDIHVVEATGGASRALSLVPSGQEVGSLSLNNTGDRLLFSMGGFGGVKDLYEVPIDSLSSRALEDPRPLAITPTDDMHAAYSPDGRHIVFTARIVERHLYELSFNSQNGAVIGEPRQITKNGKLNYYPEIAPDGRRMLWTSHRSGQGNLYCGVLNGEEIEKVTSDWSPRGREISGRFDPTGKQVIFASTQGGSYQLWRVPSIGSVGLQLTETEHPKRDVHPSLSPDGASLAFYSNRSGSWDIWGLDLDAGNSKRPRQLTDWPGNELYPVWSPDGERLAFVSDRNGNADIWTVTREGKDPQPMVVSPAEEVWSAWSLDQRWFFFISNRNGVYNIWRTPAEGGEAQPLTNFDNPSFGLPENGIYSKFAVGSDQLILSLESRKGDIYVLRLE